MPRKTDAQDSTLEVPYPSKVTLPVRRPAIIHRQRLIDALAAALEHRLTVLSAPAGYGKSTLLLDFAQSWKHPVCWYSLDERDRWLPTFLRYLLCSLRNRFPGIGAELEKALLKDAPLGPQEAIDLLMAALLERQEPFVIVLDDFHFLDDAPEELKMVLEGWLYRLPAHCHVILAGRTKPQLGILPLMSVRQEVATITFTDFAFSCDEVVLLYRTTSGEELSLDEAQHLANVTEGWAAALVLLASRPRESRTSVSLENLPRSDTLFQYITLEQFDPLPGEIKRFLTGSAVIRIMDEATVNELLGIADTEEKLTYLDQRNLFLLRDGAAPGRYRYHRLFRAFLVSTLRAQDPERFKQLNLKAASMMERAGEREEAVYHYVQAAAWDSIVQIAERVGWRLFEEGRWDTLAEWLDAVPEDELEAQPKLMLWKARVLHYLNQVDTALALLTQVITHLEAKKDWVPLAEALVTKGMCLRKKGDYQESKEALIRARTLLLQHDGPTSALTEARKELGITLSRSGQLSEAVEELESVLGIYEAQGDSYNIAHTSDQLAVTLGLAGRLDESGRHLEQARQRWMKLGNDNRLVETLNNLGMAYFLQGDYKASESVVRQGLELSRKIGNLRAEVYLLAAMGDIKRATGDSRAALEYYHSSLDQAWALDDAYILIYTMDAIAGTYLLTGDIANCESWAKKATLEAEKRGGTLERGFCLITAALSRRHQGEQKEAVELLERAIALLKEADAKRELATAYFHLASVYFSLKRKRLALEFLELAARAVKELGYDHFLLMEATRNPLLIQYAAANKLADGYFAKLLKLIKANASSGEPDPLETMAVEQGAGNTVVAYAFGHPRVEVGGNEITDLEWRSEKSKEMFFFFLCNRRPLRKEEIVTALWPDLPEEKTTSAFHSNMYRLRKALYPEVIAKDSGRYVLDPTGRFLFDVDEFQQALQRADAAPKGSAEAIQLMEKALSLYKGQFAPDFYSEWAESLRWQLEEQYMALLTSLATAYSVVGQFKKSADICQRILELDEFNDAAWYRLMSCYIQSGKMEAAKYSYNRYVQIITQDGIEEDVPDFDELCREIAAGRAS
jgi:ATP/maltotriose-dependent transcriptional regulator MalT